MSLRLASTMCSKCTESRLLCFFVLVANQSSLMWGTGKVAGVKISFGATDPGHSLQSSPSNNKADIVFSDSISLFQMLLNVGGQRDMTHTA